MKNSLRPGIGHGAWGFVVLVLGVPLMTFSARAEVSPDDAIALVHVAVEGVESPPTSDLSAALRRGLASAGLKVSALPPSAAAATCAEGKCLQELSAQFRSTLLAFADVHTSAQSYEVRMRVVSASTGETLTTDAVSCGQEDLCPPMPQTLQRLAKEAGRKTRNRLADLPKPTVTQPEAPPPVDMQFAPPRLYDVADSETPKTITPAWVPWALASAGGASLITGGVLLAMNGTCGSTTTCEPRNFAFAGWSLSAVGLAAVGTATALWLWPAPTPRADGLSLTPWAQTQSAGLSVAGRWR